ncbi:MAG: aminotransferase class IV [Deltaproteobacteria bacterium]|nr:aminotransferase class IV [Deltaproteobacteria bacterium]
MKADDTIVYVNGEMVKKSEAVISVYDSGFMHRDGVYEGIRVYHGRVFMLDEHGFVAETNGTTMSMVKDELLLTATTKHIIVGITRGLVMRIAESNGIRTIEKDLSLYDFYNADEVFICGTVGEIVPVKEMDGRSIGAEVPGKLTRMLMAKYDEITAKEGTPIDKM